MLAASGAFCLAEAESSGPVLLSDAASTRAIAVDSVTFTREPFAASVPMKFSLDQRTRIMLFAMNLDLLPGEGVNAFTAEAEDGSHQVYKLTVEHVTPIKDFEWMSSVVLRLNDELKADAGDVLIRLNLHGMSSNRVRVALGHVGGGLPDDVDSVPTPAPPAAPAPTPTPSFPPLRGPITYNDAVRFLEQSTFGPTPAEVARLQSIGYRTYLDEQYALPATSYPQPAAFPAAPDPTTCPSGSVCRRDNYSMYPLQLRFYQNALGQNAPTGTSDQLRQRVSFALQQILVVSGNDINLPSWVAPYLRIIDNNAYGNYRQLLYEMTLNPGMGRYLDMVGNSKTNPNENYAREVLQLFSVGVDQLNNDGTPKLDGNGDRIPTYSQATITNFARVFTGWNFAPQQTPGIVNYVDPMRLGGAANENPSTHDFNSKTLLNGALVPQRTSSVANAYQDLNDAIDNIFNHPNVGPYICKQLIQHLVTSNPSGAYVDRVATVFNNNRTNPRQLQAVVEAILVDPEARGSVKTDPNYGHLREPALYITNVLRAFNATAYNDTTNPSDGYLAPNSSALDEDIFRAPSVFSFYGPDYQIPGTTLLGPEFQLLSTSSALKRDNFVNQIVFTGIAKSADPTTGNAPRGTSLDLRSLRALASDPTQLVDSLNALLLHNTMSKEIKANIVTAVSAVPVSGTTWDLKRAQYAVYLVATSSQYQVER
jgi:uncharacterized protein (DUF1800 family)